MVKFLKNSGFRVLCLLAVLMILPANQRGNGTYQTGSKSYFGVLLSVSTTGNDMIFAIISEDVHGKSQRFITRQEFINIAAGKWRLKPNIKQENLFDKHGIVWGIDEDRDLIHVPILDSLWKVRYRQFPYIRGATGWANAEYMPSSAQLVYLADSFKINNINTDFFAGDQFWKLLKSAQSEVWKTEYKSLFD